MAKATRKNSVRKNTNVTMLKQKRTSKKLVSDVAEHHQFWANDGQVLQNVAQLPAALRKMNVESFAHHVNDDKHDFANWIEHAVGHKALSAEVRKVQSKSGIIQAIKLRL